jgi:hypothetical protein
MRVVVTTLLGALSCLGVAFAIAPHQMAVIVGLAIFGALWGGNLGALGAYVLAPLSLIGLVLDLTWSLLNTFVALIWLLLCLLRGQVSPATAESARSGTLVISGGELPGAAATTMGNVIGGVWLAHEEVHVWQARIFGPFYWPIYLLSYVANMIVRLVTIRFSDPHWEAYGRDVMEDWAELACPAEGPSANSGQVFWGWWFIGLLCAAFYTVCIVLIAGSLPMVRQWVPTLQVGLSSALLGLIGIAAFAVVRSFLPRTDR